MSIRTNDVGLITLLCTAQSPPGASKVSPSHTSFIWNREIPNFAVLTLIFADVAAESVKILSSHKCVGCVSNAGFPPATWGHQVHLVARPMWRNAAVGHFRALVQLLCVHCLGCGPIKQPTRISPSGDHELVPDLLEQTWLPRKL